VNNRSVAIVAHDAGGAEILASYVAQNNVNCKLVLEGPAVNVFKRRLGEIEIFSLEDAILDCDWCICGTGWQSDLEWRAIEEARNADKHVVAFVDHWVNYPERFIRNGIQHLPDEIWVGDEDAQKIASESFLDISIKLVPNPYSIDIKKQFSEIESANKNASCDVENILFVCENISDHARLKYGDERYWGYTEFDAINFFFENIRVISNRQVSVVIRPHPSDAIGKYKWIVEAYSDIAVLSEGRSLIQEVAESDFVVGCESMAMVVGLLAQKKVISCIPHMGRRCRLPQKNIVHLSEIAAMNISASN
jgi:hypothetical protein